MQEGQSRKLFWLLAVLCAVFFVLTIPSIDVWTWPRVGLMAGIAALMVLGLLGIWDRIRFEWAHRILAGSACIGFSFELARVVSTGAWREWDFLVWFQHIAGLAVFGIGGFLYALHGRRAREGWRRWFARG